MRNKIIDFHMHPFSGSMENLCHYKDGFDKDAKESRRYMEKAEIGHICGSVLDGCWPEMDLSGTGLHRFGVVKYLIDRVGADRILFGTDYPICNPGMYVAAVRMEEISEQEREKIFHINAEKLLGI